MHGIKEINFQNQIKEAERIMKNAKVADIDRDWLIRQEALDNYLKAKYGNQQNSL